MMRSGKKASIGHSIKLFTLIYRVLHNFGNDLLSHVTHDWQQLCADVQFSIVYTCRGLIFCVILVQ
jgi:hypothetical protein